VIGSRTHSRSWGQAKVRVPKCCLFRHTRWWKKGQEPGKSY